MSCHESASFDDLSLASSRAPKLMATSPSIQSGSLPIAVDLFVSRSLTLLPHDVLGFADSSGNLLYRVSRSSTHHKLISDSSGNPLISICRLDDGSWKGFKGESCNNQDMIFRVKRVLNKLTKTELVVILVSENGVESTSDIKVKGCPFQRSCTVYRGDSIIAQTSLMFKLHQIYARRNKFRLTIFPGDIDTTLVAALIVIFFDGRKLWS